MIRKQIKYSDGEIYTVGFRDTHLEEGLWECHIIEKLWFSHLSIYHRPFVKTDNTNFKGVALETIQFYIEKLEKDRTQNDDWVDDDWTL